MLAHDRRRVARRADRRGHSRAASASTAPLDLPAGRNRARRISTRLQDDRRGRTSVFRSRSSAWATTTRITPSVILPMRLRESRLVHALHAVPGRDRAGPPRVAAQLPDDGARPDGDGGGQRVAAGRGDGGRRGDDAAASRAGAKKLGDARGAFLVSDACFPQTHRRAAEPRRAARHRAARSARSTRWRSTSRRVRRAACSIRTKRGALDDLRPFIEHGARRGRAGGGRPPICWRSRC